MNVLQVIATGLLCLILGLLLGFYGWTIYWRLKNMYTLIKHNMESPPGVVVADRKRVTRNQQPINLESETGGIMALSPDQLRAAKLKERNNYLKDKY